MEKTKTQNVDTSKQLPPNAIHLSEEDRYRMAKLYEEISGRLEEMALITARNLNLETLDQIEPTFRRLDSISHENQETVVAAKKRLAKGVTIVCTPRGCGCYDNDNGICWAC